MKFNPTFFKSLLRKPIPLFSSIKNYVESDSFEDDLDYLIINLQMFDFDLDVPNMDRVNRSKRISKKIQLVKKSFQRLNIDYAPYGLLIGSFFGPKGSAIGAFLGTYIFAGCAGAVLMQNFGSESGLVPT